VVGSVRSRVLRLRRQLNHKLSWQRDTVWLIGDGRSGTTWMMELLNFSDRYRCLFEPLHPLYTPGYQQRSQYEYLRPGASDPELEILTREIFRGTFESGRPESPAAGSFTRGLLVKDVFANLLAGWVINRYPFIKPILLLRHPFSVAASKQKLHSGAWFSEPADLLLQRELCSDYLHEFEPEIRSAEGHYEKQTLIWCLAHYVPSQQALGQKALIVFYEDMCLNPVFELNRVAAHLYGAPLSAQEQQTVANRAGDPSVMSRQDSVVQTQTSGVARARIPFDKLTHEERGRCEALLQRFGLDKLYDGSGKPLLSEATKLFA